VALAVDAVLEGFGGVYPGRVDTVADLHPEVVPACRCEPFCGGRERFDAVLEPRDGFGGAADGLLQLHSLRSQAVWRRWRRWTSRSALARSSGAGCDGGAGCTKASIHSKIAAASSVSCASLIAVTEGARASAAPPRFPTHSPRRR